MKERTKHHTSQWTLASPTPTKGVQDSRKLGIWKNISGKVFLFCKPEMYAITDLFFFS